MTTFKIIIASLLCLCLLNTQAQTKITATAMPIPKEVLKEKNWITGFTLLPHAVPCVALNNGVFISGLDEWLVPPVFTGLHSLSYSHADSSIALLSGSKTRSYLSKLSIATGDLSLVDSLDGRFFKVYDFSTNYWLLSGEENGVFGLWSYSKSAGYSSPVFQSKYPITAFTRGQSGDMYIGGGGMVLHLDANYKTKDTYALNLEIDGLAETEDGHLLVSTSGGVLMRDRPSGKMIVMLDQIHGNIEVYGKAVYILDAEHEQVIKFKL
ncbi:hypothetical protein LX64_01730 [Chitinophaga skermanii]|uniref:WG repeat protein n=1 Tax=Chitinophaga skermanii TaxID=331697 RepID=A0A327QT61_9BACT|nr:hypothetical protein [Chitinophaga skermanii]RAJ06603.1 hypothetical protein LX64_01730 [Chitinophaga skermanii]